MKRFLKLLLGNKREIPGTQSILIVLKDAATRIDGITMYAGMAVLSLTSVFFFLSSWGLPITPAQQSHLKLFFLGVPVLFFAYLILEASCSIFNTGLERLFAALCLLFFSALPYFVVFNIPITFIH